MNRYFLILPVLSAAWFAPVASAALLFFPIEDAAGEQQFLGALRGMSSLGTESFASSTLSGAAEVELQGPTLAPGQPNGPFVSGTDPFLGITLQVNTLGAAPSVSSPGNTLYASGPALTGTVRVGPNLAGHSLDMFLDPPDFRGVVEAFRVTLFADGGTTGEVRVYSQDNTLLGFFSLDGLGLTETKALGIVAPAGTSLFRINYWVPDGYGDVSNLELFAIPEPSVAAIAMGLGCLALLSRRGLVGRRGR
jgi:hypothetical protein